MRRQSRDMSSRQQCAKSRQGDFSSHFAPALSNVQPLIERMDRTRDFRRPADGRFPRLAESSLSRLSLRLTKEETSCDSGSIFRVRRCNKKQSSQRGVDRRWHGRPRRACRVGDRLSALLQVSLFIPLPFSVYRHDSFDWHLYQQVRQSFFACYTV